MLCSKLDSVWKENKGQVVVFLWAQILKDETLSIIGVRDSLNFKSSRLLKKLKSCDKLSNSYDVITKTFIGKRFRAYSDSYIDCMIKSGNYSNIRNSDPRAVQDVTSSLCLKRILIDYDEKMRLETFNFRQFKCKICFSEKSGSHCTQFWPCHHVFCKNCIKSYFEIQIKEGNFKYLKCPTENCNSEANPKQV